MKFNSTLAAAVLATAVSASPIETRASTAPPFISVIAGRSGSPIHLQSLSASDGAIWIGKSTQSYCPDQVKPNCPSGNYTNFAGGDITLGMGTEVPGGQQVYIEPKTGRMQYTQAHSASMPAGSHYKGWSITYAPAGRVGELSHITPLVACPCKSEQGVWTVHATPAGVKFSEECLGFDALVSNNTQAAAWQYA